jgi:hypothetical protein
MRNDRLAVLIAAASLAIAGCSHPSRVRTPRHHPTSAPPSPTAVASPATSLPSPSPLPPASPTPAPAHVVLPPPPKKITRLPSDAAPQILDVAVSETTVHPGDRVVGRIITTSNVASVQARIGGYAVSLVKTGVGRFELAYTVGQLPWFIRGNFTLQVIARNTRGDAVTRAIPLTVR